MFSANCPVTACHRDNSLKQISINSNLNQSLFSLFPTEQKRAAFLKNKSRHATSLTKPSRSCLFRSPDLSSFNYVHGILISFLFCDPGALATRNQWQAFFFFFFFFAQAAYPNFTYWPDNFFSYLKILLEWSQNSMNNTTISYILSPMLSQCQ